MASYEQVLKFEKEAPQGVIRLVDSNGFYRAYNHSAYLCFYPDAAAWAINCLKI